MPVVAAAAGWPGSRMEASDTSLFSSAVGMMLAGRDLHELGLTVDGEVVKLPDTGGVDQAAYVLWKQLLTRIEAKPDAEYWRNMVHDIVSRQEEHREALAVDLRKFMDKLGGMNYEPMDLFTHIEQVMDDPHTVVSINPPTYFKGFERFFDTKGRLTWNEPPYEPFDPVEGNHKLTDMMRGKKALLVAQQQKDPGDCSHERPVFARHLSFGQYVYIHSNRPDEVFDITGGPKVSTRNSMSLTPADCPILPYDHEVTDESVIGLHPINAAVADYYRGLWMHRLNADPGSLNVLVTVDGHAAGVIGYSASTIQTPYQLKWAQMLLLRFAFGAPHQSLRLTRLVTALALNKPTTSVVRTATNSMALEASDGLVTVEFTRFSEAKGLRGLMKLQDRQPHTDGFKLVYTAPWTHDEPTEVLHRFLAKEQQWRKGRSKSEAATVAKTVGEDS